MRPLPLHAILPLLGLSAAAASAQVQAADYVAFSRYATENAQLPAPKHGENRVVFMGNSITKVFARGQRKISAPRYTSLNQDEGSSRARRRTVLDIRVRS